MIKALPDNKEEDNTHQEVQPKKTRYMEEKSYNE